MRKEVWSIAIKKRYLILVTVIILCFYCTPYQRFNCVEFNQVSYDLYPLNVNSKFIVSVNPSIHIDGDDEFHTTAKLNGWDGEGTPNDPYLITNQYFSLGNCHVGIFHTTVHFIILNSTFHQPNDAIHLLNVSNGVICENRIYQAGGCGIVLTFSHNIQILNNYLDECQQKSILLENCDEIRIDNNTVQNSRKNAIALSDSSNCSISNNQVQNNFEIGIKLTASNRCFIAHNRMSRNRIGCIELDNTHYTVIFNNEISEQYCTGITLSGSDFSIISKNLLSSSKVYGIELINSKFGEISGNLQTKSTIGLLIGSGSYNLNIFDNSITENSREGLKLLGSSNCIITSNLISENGDYGVNFDSCSNNSIIWNDFINNNLYYIRNSQGCFNNVGILGHNISNNYWANNSIPYYLDGNDNSIDPQPRLNQSQLHSQLQITSPEEEGLLNEITVIRWEIENLNKRNMTYNVKISHDSGWNWKDLVSNTTETSTIWDPSLFLQTSQYYIKILAGCPEGIKNIAYSNKLIVHPPLIPPTILSPKPGDQINGVRYISWSNAEDPIHDNLKYSVFLSKDTEDWILLKSHLVESRLEWDFSKYEDGPNYLLKIAAICSEGVIVEDLLDGTFEIKNHFVRTFKIQFPLQDDVLSGNIVLNWTKAEDTFNYSVRYDIYCSKDENLNWISVVSNLTVNSFTWDTTSVDNGDDYRLMIQAFGGKGESTTTVTDGTFSISNVHPPPIEIALIIILFIAVLSLVGIITYLRKRLIAVESVLGLKELKISLCVGKFMDKGLVILEKSENCPYDDLTLLSALEYSAVLIQRGDLEKIYGPFPHNPDLKGIEYYHVSFGFHLIDSNIIDSRIVKKGGETPALLLLFYPKQFDALFMVQKRAIESLLKFFVQDSSNPNKFSVMELEEIQNKIYRLLLRYKPIKMEKVLSEDY